IFQTVNGFGKEGARLAWVQVKLASGDNKGDYYIAVLEPLHELVEQLESIRRIFYFAMPAALLAAGFGGSLLARKSLAPVVAMSNEAERISAKNLHERLSVKNSRDELGRL